VAASASRLGHRRSGLFKPVHVKTLSSQDKPAPYAGPCVEEHRRNAGRIIPHGEINDAEFVAMGRRLIATMEPSPMDVQPVR
jgi:hypothetical protein